MNTFFLQLDSSGIPKGWLVPPIENDLIKQITGREIRGITKNTWEEFNLNYQTIKKITNEAPNI